MIKRRSRVAVVGASWGGLDAIGTVLGALDTGCRLAVAVALHRSPGAPDDVLVRYLQARCTLPVSEVEDKDDVEPGRVYVAPPDYHLLVEPGHFALSTDAPVRFSRPSIDVLFESAADAYGNEVLGVVLTGANDDGCRGLHRIKQAGGLTLVQDPGTAARADMPLAAIGSGAADEVLSLAAIAARLNELGRVE